MHPEKVMNIGGEKVLCFQWHPMASDLLAVALSDNSIEIWESKTLTRRRRIVSHSAPVMALGWSSDGHRLVSIGKDLMLNVHQPQLGDECLLAQKKVQLFDASSLNEIYTQQIDSGTQPLIPHYDYDSSVLFLSAKGNRTINMYEVSCDSPYLLPLTPYTAPLIGQAIAFHNKKRCDVMAVEFQRAWRLTERTLEQVIFRVPRVKKDVFQSDLFPDALVTWRPVMTAEEWLAGSSKTPQFESLMPEGVSALAKPAPFVAPSRAPQKPLLSNLEHAHEPKIEPDRKEVQNSWSAKIVEDRTLEQDEMEEMFRLLCDAEEVVQIFGPVVKARELRSSELFLEKIAEIIMIDLVIPLKGCTTSAENRQRCFFLFINGRLVQCAPLKFAVDSLFSDHDLLCTFSLIALSIDPSRIDVNVHPTKQTVLFLEEEAIIEDLQKAIQKRLKRYVFDRDLAPRSVSSSNSLLTSTQIQKNSQPNPGCLI
ncbi:DNA mismatch repair protein, partial [Ostertagia ostertagi]